MNYIIAAVLLQIFVSLILLFLNNKKEKSDYLLATLLASIGWHLLTKFYIFTSIDNPAVIFRMHTFIQLSYGPLLYLYAKKKCNEHFLPARLWFLFIPLFISVTLYGCVVAAFLTYLNNAAFFLVIYNSLVFIPIVITHIVFGVLTIKKIRNVDISERQLIHKLSLVLILVGLADALLMIISSNFPEYTLLVRSALYMLLGLIPILIIRYKYVGRSDDWQTGVMNLAFEGNGHTVSIVRESLKSTVKASPGDSQRKLLLDSSQHQEIYEVIESFVNEKKIYKDENITLEKLATLSGFSRHYISETLNVFAHKSFYQYINEYRVKEVISLLSDENKENKGILSIAYSSGFKNKASFNQNFKRITGCTPSKYLRIKNDIDYQTDAD